MINRPVRGALVGMSVAVMATVSAAGCATAQAGGAGPSEVRLYGNPQSAISSGVILPPTTMIWTSGTVAPVADPNAAATSRERFGDTATQARNIMRRIDEQLREQGLSLRDVVYIRAYVAPDPANNNQFDFAGWNAAYGEFFNNAANPTKVARSTVGVAALVSPNYLIELEAFATYPAR